MQCVCDWQNGVNQKLSVRYRNRSMFVFVWKPLHQNNYFHSLWKPFHQNIGCLLIREVSVVCFIAERVYKLARSRSICYSPVIKCLIKVWNSLIEFSVHFTSRSSVVIHNIIWNIVYKFLYLFISINLILENRKVI